MEYKWAEFLTGGFASPVIRIDNATDLKNFAETKGDFSNLSANAVYSHLQSNQ